MRRHPLLLLLGCLLLTAPPATAALRSPQAPVAGTALASFFASQGQLINPATDQQDLQQLSVAIGTSFELRAYGPDATASAGVYTSFNPSPPLCEIWPSAAAAGWFTVSTFRASPTRLVVNIFDAGSVLQGTNTYVVVDPSAFAFYANVLTGAVFQQDGRNPGGAPRILSFSGTGARQGYTWFAVESNSNTGGDFADFILLVNLGLAPVDVERARWGELKQLFR